MKIINLINKNQVATRSNILIEARHKLNLQEQRFFLWVISCIQPDDKEFEEYVFNVSTFSELIDSPDTNSYKSLKEVTKSIIGKVVEVPREDGKGIIQVGLISSADYNYGEGTVSVTVHQKLKPYLLDLKEKFTSIQLKNIMPLRSIYSQKIYELLKSRQGLGQRKFSVEELRDKVGLDKGVLSRWDNFETRVLKTSEKEINEKTDILIKYEKIKTGRKYTAVNFTIKSNKKNAKKGQLLSPIPQLAEVEALIKYGVPKTKAIKLFKDHSEKTTEALESYKNNSSEIKNPAGWLITYIEQEWTDGEKEIAKIKKDDKKAKIRQEVLRQSMEREKLHQEKSYSKYRIAQVKKYVDTLPDKEEDKLWSKRDSMFGNGLFGKVTSVKGRERWTSAMNMHQNIEFLETVTDLDIVEYDVFLEKIYKK